ncbi:UDP-N-acetylmuramate--L-alanine ligase [Frankia sp. Cppng1_Ct_nod]|uniref:UDP-N-acetylmuramate--L-alanine ligase n=1 Tax=Frankia sp. Cppng1_Ct_nod TaxID=2897162 RepID=UPI001F5E5E68|nr:UDP-N-acetylmuramate--L-alanine ligase [Frankia sp. Cppng1_Ct_nod]
MTAPALPDEFDRVHLVGIGGAGMSGLARLLLRRGAYVSGSDARDSRRLAALRALGAQVAIGHDPGHLGDARTLIFSQAIPDGNPEVEEAKKRGLCVVSRSAALAALMRGFRGLAVAGTHGKTTTTLMATVALQACGADPSFMIGSDINEAGSNAHAGSGEIFIAEADESDGGFLFLEPFAAVVTNVEADHLDYYRRPEDIDIAFTRFVDGVDPDGFVVACLDDPGAARLVAALGEREGAKAPRVTTYGESADANVRVELPMISPTGSTCEVVVRGRRLGELTLQVPGRHNLLNAAGALAAGLELGLPAAGLLEGLKGFAGVRRRFESKGTVDGIRVIDDYANHPTKIRSVLRTAHDIADGGSVVVAFQPHLYSRTAAFASEFGAVLALADAVVVMDVFGAGERQIPGVSGAMIASRVPLPADRVVYEPSWSAAAGRVAAFVRPGDLVLTVGAGDVTLLGGELLRVLAERASLPG